MKPPKLTLKVKDFVRDIRSGLTDAELMKKYHLSSAKLRSALKKLVDAKAISPSELLEEHSICCDDTEGIEYTVIMPRDTRLLSRYEVRSPLTIYADKHPDVKGVVVNISGQGIGIKGLNLQPGQVSMLVVPAEAFAHIEPIVFRARCRWTQPAALLRNCSCGLEITTFMEGADTQLRKLVRDLMIQDRCS